MIILLHGNGLTALSQKISSIKKDFDPLSVVIISGKEKFLADAVMEISTPQLFSEKRLIIWEDFEDKIDLEKLPTDPNLTIILKFSKNLASNSTLLKSAQKLKIPIYNFTEEGEANIFPYLDLLAGKNPQALKEVDFRLTEHGSQYLLTMIFYMLRRLVRPKNLSPYVIKKVAAQKRNFPVEKIQELYKFALETDFKIKSGLLEENLGLTLLVDKIIS